MVSGKPKGLINVPSIDDKRHLLRVAGFTER